MWLCEVVFQGIFGLDRPAKVRVDPGFCSLALPEGASAADFHTLILSLIYPQHVGASELRPLINHPSANVRLGLVVDPTGEGTRTYKVYRRLEDDSVALQDAQGADRGKEIARGHLEVGLALERRLNLPSFKNFLLLNCWIPPKVAPPPPRATLPSRAPSPKSSDIERLVEMLNIARRLETVDVELDNAQADLGEFKRKNKNLDKQIKRVETRQSRIHQIRQALSLNADERALLTGYKERQIAFDKRHQSLNAEIEATREQQGLARPVPLIKDYVLVACSALALILFITSAAIDVRPLALINILLLGAVAWTLSRRYERLEQAHVLNIRVEQILRHLESLQQERVDHERDYKRLLVRANLKDASEFESLQSELDELELGDDDIDEDLHRRVQLARAEEARLNSLIADLNARKDDIGEVNLPVYEIENQLTALGVDTYGLGADPLAPPDPALAASSPPPSSPPCAPPPRRWASSETASSRASRWARGARWPPTPWGRTGRRSRSTPLGT